MANSTLPGILGARSGASDRIPSRTPGVLGYLDQADPTRTTLLGDTPGPVGSNDRGDPTLAPIRTRKHRELLARDDEGRPLALAHAVPQLLPKPAAPQIPLEQVQSLALQITTTFEGGKPMNYQAVAGDFDGQGVSFGLIQWNFGQDTLGPLLKRMLAQNAASFAGCFGKDADYEALKKALEQNSNAAQLKWARAQQESNKAWKATFTALGAVDAFNRIQRDEACAKYHPLVVGSIQKLRGVAADLMESVQVRSYVALFDLCVQQHGLGKAMEAIRARVAKEKPQAQVDLLRIAVVERGRAASTQWAADCISRRMGILDGSPYEALEFKVTSKRANSQLALLAQYENAEVQGL